MALKLVEAMVQHPGACLICHGTPTENGKPLPAVHAEGLDVNWGDSVYLCDECCGIIADLVDRPTRAQWDETRKVHETLLEQFHALEKEAAELRDFKEKVLGGREAIRSAKAEPKRAPRKRAA